MASRRIGIFRGDASEDGDRASHVQQSEETASADGAGTRISANDAPGAEEAKPQAGGSEPPATTAVFDRLADGVDEFSPPNGPALERAALETARAQLADAERRAATAEAELAKLRAERASSEADAESEPVEAERIRLEAEDRARALAANWLRRQLALARAEADERLAEAVEASRREAEARADAEIARAGERSEERLREIERRALAAAERVASAEEELGREIERLRTSAARRAADEGASAERRTEPEAPTRARGRDLKRAGVRPTPAGSRAVEPERVTGLEPPEPVATDSQGPETGGPSAALPGAGRLSLSRADYAELRALGMSATQAKRVLRHRDEHGRFGSVDELGSVPGFPRAFLSEVKPRLAP